MRPTTVRASLVAILLVVQAITLSILLVSVQRETETLFREHARATMSHLAETVADRTRRFLLPAEAAIGIGRQLVSDGVLHSDSDVDLERYFLAQLRASADVAGIFLGRRDGSFVYVMRNADGFRTKFIQVRDGVREVRFAQRDASQRVVREWADAADRYDPRTRPWYTRARRNEGMIWTDPYMFYSSRRPGITAAIALQSPSGADGGVIGVDVELLSLSGFVSKIPIGRHGSAVIRDDRGVAVASSSADRLVASFGDEKLPAATEIAPPALQALLARVPSPGKDRSAVPRPAPLASGLPARVAVEGSSPTSRDSTSISSAVTCATVMCVPSPPARPA
ncbi:MAG: cache domain-containing protein [Burkholderiaceae bacterium]